jgi:RHS repeat-associated protein
LQSVTDVVGHAVEYTYDATHLLKKVNEVRNGVLTTVVDNTYDSSQRVMTQLYPMGRSLQFGYSGSPSSATTRMTDTLGLITLHNYTYNRIKQISKKPGATAQQANWTYTYVLSNTWPSALKDARDRDWSYTWDAFGNMLTANDPENQTINYFYTAFNDLDKVTDADLLTTDYNYDSDSNGNLKTVKRRWAEAPGGARDVIVTYNYDPSKPGDVTSIVDERNNSWGFTYDAYGYPSFAKNPPPFDAIEYIDYDYDGAGRLRRVANPLDRQNARDVEYEYNARNQVTRFTDALLASTVYRYDPVGNLQYVTGPTGQTITNTYNLNNELERVTQPDGSYSVTTYDFIGRIKTRKEGVRDTWVYASENPNKAPTTYNYFDNERRVEVIDPLNRKTQYLYEPSGLLDQAIDAQNRSTYFRYYFNGWLQTINYEDPGTTDLTYKYNGRGLRTEMKDSTGTTNYGYDSLGRLTWVFRNNDRVDLETSRVDYGYDAVGNLEKIIYPARPGLAARSVTRHFDAANRMDWLADFFGNKSKFGYDDNGNLDDIDYVETEPAGGLNLRTSIGYDARNLFDTITHQNNATSGSIIYSVDYGRNDKGLVYTSAESAGGVTTQHTYDYDALDHLKQDNFVGPSASIATWDNDALGQVWANSKSAENLTTTRDFDLAGQIKSLEEKLGTVPDKLYSFGYDPNGNRTTTTEGFGGSSLVYTYDQANRLKVPDPSSSVEYIYDGDGLRQYKHDTTVTYQYEHFAWDIASGTPLLLQDSRAHYIYGPGGMLLSIWGDQGDLTGTQPYHYYLLDQQGSVKAVADPAGNVKQQYDYNAYGGRQEGFGSHPYNPFGYVGQYWDQESELLYMRGRYYDTFTQQFISRDPQEALSGQPYVYAGGNPVNFSDPTGSLPSLSSMFQTADDGVPGPDDDQQVAVGGGGGGSVWSVGGGRLGQNSIQGAMATRAARARGESLEYGVTFKGDMTGRVTERAARRAVFRQFNIPTSLANNFKRLPDPDKNRNIRGPRNQRAELVETTNVHGETVTIKHHKYGHFFADVTPYVYEGPHYLGPGGNVFYTPAEYLP